MLVAIVCSTMLIPFFTLFLIVGGSVLECSANNINKESITDSMLQMVAISQKMVNGFPDALRETLKNPNLNQTTRLAHSLENTIYTLAYIWEHFTEYLDIPKNLFKSFIENGSKSSSDSIKDILDSLKHTSRSVTTGYSLIRRFAKNELLKMVDYILAGNDVFTFIPPKLVKRHNKILTAFARTIDNSRTKEISDKLEKFVKENEHDFKKNDTYGVLKQLSSIFLSVHGYETFDVNIVRSLTLKYSSSGNYGTKYLQKSLLSPMKAYGANLKTAKTLIDTQQMLLQEQESASNTEKFPPALPNYQLSTKSKSITQAKGPVRHMHPLSFNQWLSIPWKANNWSPIKWTSL